MERGPMRGRQNKETQRLGPRRVAAGVLGRVYGQGAFADIALSEVLEGVRTSDRALATGLVYGVLRRTITIDWIIEGIPTVRLKKMETSVLTALRLGVYQIFFLGRVPDRAAVDESVRLVRGRARKGLVNAILRKAASRKGELLLPGRDVETSVRLSIRGSHPLWMVRRWLSRYNERETAALLRAGLGVPKKTIRVNTLRASMEGLLRELGERGLCVRKGVYSPSAVQIISGVLPPDMKEAGHFVEQDEASQLVSLLLSPRPGELVLDACAAPGVKTTHMAAMMEDRGRIIAVDRSVARLGTLERMARRLGATIIKTLAADSTRAGFLGKLGLPPFDAILVDAPCSGLGVLGRTPDIKLHRRESDMAGLAGTQKRIIENILPFLRPGGRLVYSVCTLEPEETDEVVEFFLKTHDDVCLEDAARVLPPACPDLVDGTGCLRTLPHRHHMDGFFGARFRKMG